MNKNLVRATTAITGATAALLVATVVNPASAAPAPTLRASIDRPTFRTGDKPVITVTENVTGARTFSVTDTSGATWTRTSNTSTSATFTTTARSADGNVTIAMTRTRDGATAKAEVAYRIEQWPGHVPGHVVLGMSCTKPCTDEASELGRPYGVHRRFYQWGAWSAMASDIDTDHAAARLPWVSVKSPGGAVGWRAIAAGDHDAAIRTLASTLKSHDDQPVILTFHHEPSNDATEAEGKDWGAAYARIHDVLKAEGALVNVAYAPIIGDWLFNPKNAVGDPVNWVTPTVLSRASFFGVDLYEQSNGETFAERIPKILSYLTSQGYPNLQVGIGEFASTDAAYPKKSAVQWLNESLTWATQNPDKIGVAAYYNTAVNSRDGVYWPLDESPAKLATFQDWLANPLVN